MSYYYLVASLPRLVFGEPPPFSPEVLVAKVEDLMDPCDLVELQRVLAHQTHEGQSDFSRAWHSIDTQMRNASARTRARRRGIDPSPYLRSHQGFRVYLDQAVARAMEAPSPLETERELDAVRWQWLEEAAAKEPFGLAALLSFAVRLQLAGRWAVIDQAAGDDRLESLIEGYSEGALDVLGPRSGTSGG